MPILLASGSPYRKQLLQKIFDSFDVAVPDLDESPLPDETPLQLSTRLAAEKAEALRPRFPTHWIIGSDQVAMRGETRLDKPETREQAGRQLAGSSGQCVTFYTSICLITPTGKKQIETDLCKVYFRTLADDQIHRYFKREQPYDCAASFKSEGLGITLISRIEGNDPNALVGLPLILLTKMMEQAGMEIP
ncbi:MAG: septum formation inhibitor Maf [Methylococcales bacterium]|nr:septum formation inhibitor Maf [Methylococcales bacterium]